MTSLVVWMAYSQHKTRRLIPVGLYIASDSRITWGSASQRWDSGRKIFGLQSAPHLFGYCGDVVFPSLALGQVASALDADFLFRQASTADEKHDAIYTLFRNSFSTRQNAPDRDFWIVHLMREKTWPTPKFRVWVIEFKAKGKIWSSTEEVLPDVTRTIAVLGTGAATVRAHIQRWHDANGSSTSSTIFSGFCEALRKGADKNSGGPPQLAAIFSAEAPRALGVLHKSQLYLNGLQIPEVNKKLAVAWFDERLQRINPITLQRMERARVFPVPTSIK